MIAVEDAARYRDGLGTPLPPGPARDACSSPSPIRLAISFAGMRARTVRLPAATSARVSAWARAVVDAALVRLRATGRVTDGEFRPGGRGREWCDAEVLRSVRQRSLAKLRQQVEPVDASALGRFLVTWHGLARPRTGLDGLLDVIEQLQGVPIVASLLEREVLPARVRFYTPDMLDTLLGAGEVTWTGVEPLGERDGRIALYLTDHVSRLRPPDSLAPARNQGLTERDTRLVSWLHKHGASFFAALHDAAGGGFPKETVDAIWDLVWQGLLTNDTHARVARVHRAAGTRQKTRPHRRIPVATPDSAVGRRALDAGRRGGDRSDEMGHRRWRNNC